MSVEVQRFDDAQVFLDEAGPFLAEREAEHNLIFGIASTMVVDPDRFASDATAYLAVVRREDEVVAAAVWTPPFKAVLSLSEDHEAITALARDLGHVTTTLSGVTAPVDVARRFVDTWSAHHPVAPRHWMSQRIYRVERVVPVVGIEGSMRVGTTGDRALLIDWLRDFLAEVDDVHDDVEARVVVDSALQTGSRTFYLWEVDGRIVSMAGVTGPTPNGIRLGPVYTPPDERGHGYASAVTAGATQLQLDAGKRFVFLFTDLANPTSNRIYQAIGYEPVIDVDQWTFQPVGPT
jgi:predicted GNAT family acetyltransferase